MIYYQVVVTDRITRAEVVVLSMATRHEALSFIGKFGQLSCCDFTLREEEFA